MGNAERRSPTVFEHFIQGVRDTRQKLSPEYLVVLGQGPICQRIVDTRCGRAYFGARPNKNANQRKSLDFDVTRAFNDVFIIYHASILTNMIDITSKNSDAARSIPFTSRN
jgi:hypothetical protein